MRICIDIDGVVCRLRKAGQTYAELEPIPGAVERLRSLKAAGHYLIFFTARHMKTCEGNVGMVIARQGKTLLDWLARHDVAYDEIHFGKPHADVYIDDNAFRFESWDKVNADGSNLPLSTEKKLAAAGRAGEAGGHFSRRGRGMNIVIPMAGRGSRFADVGYRLPKPMIPVLGRPMYSWAVDSMPLSAATRLIFVCLAEHLAEVGLEADIQSRYGTLNPVVISLDHVTDGQACTVLLARRWIDNADPLIIFNADTWCRTNLARTLPAMPASVAGILGVFRAPGDRWSFARTNAEGRVVETAEKKRISDLACTGLYHFSRGGDYCRHADAMIAANDRTRNEFYVAPIYNRMIADGLDIRVDVAEEAAALGTPEDLASFLSEHGPRLG